MATALALLLSVDRAGADDPDDPPPAPDTPPAAAPDDGVPAALDDRIKIAVDRGLKYVRGKARATGSWGSLAGEHEGTYGGGTDSYSDPYGATSLALYALMKCGVADSDPIVKSGLAWLRKTRDDGEAYEIAMELLAVTATADPFKTSADATAAGLKVHLSAENRTWAQGLLATLLKQRGTLGWRYWGKGKDDLKSGGDQDLSSTQLAVLAMYAAERCGLKIDPKVWSDVIRFALAQQDEEGPAHRRAVRQKPPPGRVPAGKSEGTSAAPKDENDGTPDRERGFAYARRHGVSADDRAASGSMTACGIGIEAIARFSLMSRSSTLWAKENAAVIQQSMYDGLAWLDANWTPYENTGGSGYWHLYYVYCVERAMDLIGSQWLGKHAWYIEMAEEVLTRQQEDGSWKGGASSTYNPNLLDTCFALLFLHRATRGGIPYPSVTGGSDTPPVDNR